MDALKNLIANCPDWVKRLDELNGQIEQRQIELAQLTESQSVHSSGRSIKNRGSTESLRPKDEPEAHPRSPPRDASPAPEHPPQTVAKSPAAAKDKKPPSSPTSNSNSPSALQCQTNQVMELAQSRARATLRKRHRPNSVVSAEGAAPKYRSRSMIIVYYDSYVQSFFEELVKFVSASRNMMRKAKMAAKVAQIKRMAELEMPDDAGDDDAGSGAEEKPAGLDAPLEAASQKDGQAGDSDELPALQYISTRRMRAVARTPGGLAMGRPMYTRAGMAGRGAGMVDQPPDVYDELDKSLEYVQSMCEHAAHQFLRDGDCSEEVDIIKRRLAETKDMADKEIERVRKDPEAAKAAVEEPTKTRSFRPQSMRREATAPSSPSAAKPGGSSPSAAGGELEVDEGIDDMGADIPKLVYKSTRAMRGPPA